MAVEGEGEEGVEVSVAVVADGALQIWPWEQAPAEVRAEVERPGDDRPRADYLVYVPAGFPQRAQDLLRGGVAWFAIETGNGGQLLAWGAVSR